jgi:hypothetical protein
MPLTLRQIKKPVRKVLFHITGRVPSWLSYGKDWSKAGADRGGSRLMLNRVDGFFHRIDWNPIGDKLGDIENLRSAVVEAQRGEPANVQRILGLRSPPAGLTAEDWKRIARHANERFDAENNAFKKMKKRFDEWGVELGRIGLSVEKIPLPHKIDTQTHEELGDLMTISAPSIKEKCRKLYGERGFDTSQRRVSGWGLVLPQRDVFKKRLPFAFGKLHDVEKGHVRIGLVQPIEFWSHPGKYGRGPQNRIALTPENTHITVLGVLLTEAERRGARRATLGIQIMDKNAYERSTYKKVYEDMAKLAMPSESKQDKGLADMLITGEFRRR